MLNNGYDNCLGTDWLGGTFCVNACVCMCVSLSVFTQRLTLKSAASPQRLQDFAQCDFIFLHLFVFIFLLILWFKRCFWQWLPWLSWWGRGGRHERSAQTNLEKHESFSVILFQPNLPLRQAHHGSVWLMTAAIVGPCACDLLIKFVFTPRELVGPVVRQEHCPITKYTDS